MPTTTTFQHKFKPGDVVYVFSRNGMPAKTKVESVVYKENTIFFEVMYATECTYEPLAEDMVYGSVDEILEAQRKELERE